MSLQAQFMGNIAARMRAWGFTIHEVSGWQTRDAAPGSAFSPGGLFIEHHDASTILSGVNGALAAVTTGRADLAGPLSPFFANRVGEGYLVAAGISNQAGLGGPTHGVPKDDANRHSTSVEVANNGLGEAYDPRLTRFLVHLEAAWAIEAGRTADYVLGHKEWAPLRKTDPVIDMNTRRAAVAAVIANGGPLEDDMPLTDDDAKKLSGVVWTYGADGKDTWPIARLIGVDAKTGVIAAKVEGLDAKVDALTGQLAKLTVGGGTVAAAGQPIDYAKLAAAIADEQDRRARDSNPATGPVS